MKGLVWLHLKQDVRRESVNEPGHDRGALSLPLVLGLLAVVFLGIGTWGVMRHWRHLVELQTRLDRCVGRTALALKNSLNSIETDNQRIIALRASAAAASLTVVGSQAIATAARALALHQDILRDQWRLRQVPWRLRGGCDGHGDVAGWLPDMSWERGPDDVYGPQPLQWKPGADRRLRIELAHSPRAAAAVVEATEGGLLENWKTHWSAPGLASRVLGAVAH